MAWYKVVVGENYDSNLGSENLSKAIEIATQLRTTKPTLRSLSVIDESNKEVWRETEQVFDLETLKTVCREGCVVLGSKGCGKTNTAMVLANDLRSHGALIRCFDSSLQWKRRSDFRTYDLSTYTCLQMQNFVNRASQYYFMKYVNYARQGVTARPLVLVYEEIQNLIGTNQLRARVNAEALRYFTQSRNYNLSYIAISQKPQLVDSNIVELSGVRIFMKSEGDRTRRKLSAWLTKEQVKELADYKRGQALIQIGNEAKQVAIPKYTHWQGFKLPTQHNSGITLACRFPPRKIIHTF